MRVDPLVGERVGGRLRAGVRVGSKHLRVKSKSRLNFIAGNKLYTHYSVKKINLICLRREDSEN